MPMPSAGSSRVLHWGIALTVLGALMTGYATTRTDTFSLVLLRSHLALGVTAGSLSLLRVIMWFYLGAPDRLFDPASRFQAIVSKSVHASLRFVPLILLVSGIGMLVISGSIEPIVDGTMSSLSQLEPLPPRNLHHAAAMFLGLLILLHTGAALWHSVRSPLPGT